MQKRIGDIYMTIHTISARTCWERGVIRYADELLDAYLGNQGLSLKDIHVRIGKITEADLLRGAPNWERYSRGGMALVSNEAISRRLYPKAKQKKLAQTDLLSKQAEALAKAAEIVLGVVNWREEG